MGSEKKKSSTVLAACRLLLLLGFSGACPASGLVLDGHTSGRPLPPDYRFNPDGSVNLRVCYNWSCARTEELVFSRQDLSAATREMMRCSGTALHERLQSIRIGIWQMENLARKYLPVLANDRAVNDQDQDSEGRTDCVDNTSNTTTFLRILNDLSMLDGWIVSTPRVRDRFNLWQVHWTAVIIDERSGDHWSVDSWFRPHGHLPYLMPLADWIAGKKGWKAPFDKFNPYPRYISEICEDGRSGFGKY